MNKLFSLLKASMSGGLILFNYRGKTERSRRVMPILLGALIGLMMFFSTSTMTAELKNTGGETAILSVYTLITAIIIMVEGSYKAVDLLFKPRDNDTLLAMPIERSTIVFARIIKFYIFEMVYCLIFLLPAIIAYAMNVEVDMSYYLVAITMLVLVPVIPITIACIIGLLISAGSGRFKHKTFLQVVFSFVALFASVGLAFLINNFSPDYEGSGMIVIGNKIADFYYPASAFVNLATHFSIIQFLLFIVVNLVILGLTCIIISRFCFRIITKLGTINRTQRSNANYSFVNHSQISAMIKKEILKYFNTPVLLMNTAIGLVFFVIAVGMLCFQFDDIIGSMFDSVEDFPFTVENIRSFLPSVTFAMVAFASLLTCITATLFSLEGKAFNTLKTLPISGIKVIMAKVFAAVLLIVPVTALGSLAMAIRFRFGIIETILILIGVVAMPLLTELLGILINLKYPRFDADNDAVVVKQSASVMVATFLGLGMVLFTIPLTFIAVFFAGQIVGLIMIDAMFVILCLFLYFVVAMRGEEYYMRLVA